MPAQIALYPHSTTSPTATRDLSDGVVVAAIIDRLRDDEDFDLLFDVVAAPLPPTPAAPLDLAGRYRTQLNSSDLATRALATEQLKRMDRSRGVAAPNPDPDSTSFPVPVTIGSGGDLLSMIAAAVGPLTRRSNGTHIGGCPWHASKSGSCLVVWPDDGRWWCSSCKRGGNTANFLSLLEGIDYHTARRKLRMGLAPKKSRPPQTGRHHA